MPAEGLRSDAAASVPRADAETAVLIIAAPGVSPPPGLHVPFQTAVVLKGDNVFDPGPGQFARIVVNLPALRHGFADGILGHLTPDGEIIVPLSDASTTGSDKAQPDEARIEEILGSLSFEGLAWGGVDVRFGLAAAVLRPDATGEAEETPAIRAGLAAAHTAYRLGVAQGEAVAAIASAQASAEQGQLRRRSEQSLLDHIEALVQELERERARRIVPRALTRARALLRQARNRARSLWAQREIRVLKSAATPESAARQSGSRRQR